MLRDMLSSRAFLAGLVFFVLIVGGTQLYSWHVRRSVQQELDRTNRIVQQLENKKETRPAQDASVPTETEILGELDTSLETDEPQPMIADTEALPIDGDANTDLVDDFESNAIGDEESADVQVSPYGFGPYPEIPTDFPFEVNWTGKTRQGELLARVMIKAWSKGERFLGASIEYGNGKVYIHYPRTVYVDYSEKLGLDGSVIGESRSFTSAGDVEIPLEGIEFPPDVRVIDYHSAGIDPYAYLDLP